jgi:hypothetical protein
MWINSGAVPWLGFFKDGRLALQYFRRCQVDRKRRWSIRCQKMGRCHVEIHTWKIILPSLIQCITSLPCQLASFCYFRIGFPSSHHTTPHHTTPRLSPWDSICFSSTIQDQNHCLSTDHVSMDIKKKKKKHCTLLTRVKLNFL